MHRLLGLSISEFDTDARIRWRYQTGMNRIRELRKAAGLTQPELAKLMGSDVDKMKVSRLETSGDRLSVYWMQRVAEALKVHPADLLDMAALAELADDVAPFEMEGLAGVAGAISQRGLRVYRVTGRSVERAGVTPGSPVTVDESEPAIAGVKSGDIVLVRVERPVQAMVLRQFMAPDMLVTNRHGANVALDLSDDRKIVGVVIPPA